MILSYKEAVEKYGNEYKLSQAVADQRIFKQESGIYSTDPYESELAIITKKYPKTVLAGEYAFYFHGLTNLVPEKYDLATPSKAAKISDPRVRQIYINNDYFAFGIVEKDIDGTIVRVMTKSACSSNFFATRTACPTTFTKRSS